MKLFLLLFLTSLFSIAFSQRDDFTMRYETFGMGSNLGDSSCTFTVKDSRLYIKATYKHSLDSLVNIDTLNKKYFIYEDNLYLKTDYKLDIRNSTIDSIEQILKQPGINYSNSNSCIKSGSAHQITIYSDSIGRRQFQFYNTFDSTALEITDLLLAYLPAGFDEFRPFHRWSIDQKCKKSIKLRYDKELTRRVIGTYSLEEEICSNISGVHLLWELQVNEDSTFQFISEHSSVHGNTREVIVGSWSIGDKGLILFNSIEFSDKNSRLKRIPLTGRYGYKGKLTLQSNYFYSPASTRLLSLTKEIE